MRIEHYILLTMILSYFLSIFLYPTKNNDSLFLYRMEQNSLKDTQKNVTLIL